MYNNILEIIKDRGLIKKLQRKTNRLERFTAQKFEKHFIYKLFIPSFGTGFLITAFIMNYLTSISNKENAGYGIVQDFLILFVAFSFFILLLNSCILKLINKKQSKKHNIKYNSILEKQIGTKNYKETYKLYESFNRLEKKLTKKEIDYLTKFNFRNQISPELKYLEIYRITLSNVPVEDLIDNKDFLIKNIQENFDIPTQKQLFNEIADIINNKTVDKELNNLNAAFEKNSKKNEQLEIVNEKINKESIIKRI